MAKPANLTEYSARLELLRQHFHQERGSTNGIVAAEVLDLLEYGENPRDSLAGISLPSGLSELQRTVTLTATANPLTAIYPVHVDIANLADLFRGDSLTPNADGTITVNRDIQALGVTSMCTARYASNTTVVFGICIGDPSALPTLSGTSTDTLPNGTYLSRYLDSERGEGTNRQVTFQTPYYPVSKTGIIGAKEGDKVFPVMWTQENAATEVIIDELIFTVETFPLI